MKKEKLVKEVSGKVRKEVEKDDVVRSEVRMGTVVRNELEEDTMVMNKVEKGAVVMIEVEKDISCVYDMSLVEAVTDYLGILIEYKKNHVLSSDACGFVISCDCFPWHINIS